MIQSIIAITIDFENFIILFSFQRKIFGKQEYYEKPASQTGTEEEISRSFSKDTKKWE